MNTEGLGFTPHLKPLLETFNAESECCPVSREAATDLLMISCPVKQTVLPASFLPWQAGS